jgi:hypothetical protein
LVIRHADQDAIPGVEGAVEQQDRQPVAQLSLQNSAQRPRAVLRVVAAGG